MADIQKSLQAAIQNEIEKIVEKEAEKAGQRVVERVRAKQGEIATRLFRHVEFRQMKECLRIEVRFPDGGGAR